MPTEWDMSFSRNSFLSYYSAPLQREIPAGHYLNISRTTEGNHPATLDLAVAARRLPLLRNEGQYERILRAEFTDGSTA